MKRKGSFPNLNPKAIAGVLGTVKGLDLLLHAWTQLSGNYFWWFTPVSNEVFLSRVPGFSLTGFGVVWAGAAGVIYGAVLGWILASMYNWFNHKWK